jgi:hypothetical protein
MELPNADYANLRSSLVDLLRAREKLSASKTVRTGVRQATPPSAQDMQAKRQLVDADLMTILQSPLNPTKPPAYGPFSQQAIGPARRLRETLRRLVEGDDGSATDSLHTRVISDTDRAELRGRLEDLVRSVDPSHPFLRSNDGEEDDDDVGDDGANEAQQ